MMDAWGGAPVKTELSALEEVNSSGPQEKNFENRKELVDLLKHAVKTTRFYSSFDSGSFFSFPVITKATIKESYDNFVSDAFERDSLYEMTTSGSTGTPFTCLHDYGKKKSTYAEVLYYNGMIGYDIGRRIIYLRSVVEECSKTPLQQFMQNIYLVDCHDLSDAGIESLLDRIRELSTRNGAMLMGYASTLDAFRDYFRRKGVAKAEGVKLYGVASGSEMLFDDTREAIQQAFGCRCVSRYSNEENGFLAQDLFHNNEFVINKAHFIYEVLSMNSDEPAAEGEVGRIVITDLRNYSMPMIRYDTGDVGRLVDLSTDKGECYSAIVDFGGRRVDVIYDCYGNRISPHSVTNLMWRYTDVNQYQLVQKDESSYLLKLNVPDAFSRDQELIADLMKVLGGESRLMIERVADIPVLASRKRRYIVNECGMHRDDRSAEAQ